MVTNELIVKTGDTVLYSGTVENGRTVDITDYNQVYWYWKVKPISSAGYGAEGSDTQDITFDSPFVRITYDANGGTDAPEARNVCINSDTMLSSEIPTRNNHKFLGWSTSSSAHSADYAPSDEIIPDDDITFYAVWGPAVFIRTSEGIVVNFNQTTYTN